MEEYHRATKRYTDRLRRQRLRQTEGVNDDSITYVGVQCDRLRQMTEVASLRLAVGHTFPTKAMVALRIAEEAIQVNKYVTTNRSDHTQLCVIGLNFCCHAHKTDRLKWVVDKVAINVEGEGYSTMPVESKIKPSTPLRSEWLVVLLVNEIRKTPNISNVAMRDLLTDYATPYAITDNVLQNTRTAGKV